MHITDLTDLTWDTKKSDTSGTGGTYLKSIKGSRQDRRYYKLSNYDSYLHKEIGYESIFEVVASRLALLLGFNAVEYNLLKARVIIDNIEQIVFVCESKEFKHNSERKIALDEYYNMNCSNVIGSEQCSLIPFLKGLGIWVDIERMLLFDFLIINRDRHGANIELLFNGELRLSPLFDNGVSFTAPLGMDLRRVEAFEPDTDVSVNNFIGSRSLFYNLDLINSTDIEVNKLPDQEELGNILFKGIEDTLPDIVKDKILDIILWRYNYAKDKKVFSER